MRIIDHRAHLISQPPRTLVFSTLLSRLLAQQLCSPSNSSTIPVFPSPRQSLDIQTDRLLANHPRFCAFIRACVSQLEAADTFRLKEGHKLELPCLMYGLLWTAWIS